MVPHSTVGRVADTIFQSYPSSPYCNDLPIPHLYISTRPVALNSSHIS